MASSSRSTWTAEQNKAFEDALALYVEEKVPDRWKKIAKVVGKSEEEVKRHYQKLVADVKHIESGNVPFPYKSRTKDDN